MYVPGTIVPTTGGFSYKRVKPKLPNSPFSSSSRLTSMVWAVSREYCTGLGLRIRTSMVW